MRKSFDVVLYIRRTAALLCGLHARGDQISPANLRDTEWETQSCVFGWPLQGAWGEQVAVDIFVWIFVQYSLYGLVGIDL